MTTVAAIRTPGFSQPVQDAQRVFRAVLEALSRPTLAQPVEVDLAPPAPLDPVAGAIVLALVDAQTPVWLDDALRRSDDVTAWIRFHTGAAVADDPSDAAFCVASTPSAAPALDEMRQGSDEEPHLSATLIIGAGPARPTGLFSVTGPGVNGEVDWDGAGLPSTFLAQWKANNARFPRGVDVLIAGVRDVRGLPRTAVIEPAAETEEAR